MNRIKVVYTGDQLYSIKHKILKPYRYNKFEIDLQLTTAWFVKLCNNKIFGNIWNNHPHSELEIIKIFDHRGIL